MPKFEFKKNMIIGMVHLLPLINTTHYKDNNEEIIKRAIEDAKTLEGANVDAIMVENMGDSPLRETLKHEQAIMLAVIVSKIVDAVNIPVGVDAAFNDYKTSLSISKATGASFIRIPVFVDTVIYHDGIIYPKGASAIEYRKEIMASDVKILADIQVKYTYMLNQNIKIEDSAKMAEANHADAVIVTGSSSGDETPIDLVERVKRIVKIPVFIGSGLSESNILKELSIADGAIVGSSLKKDKKIENPISFELTRKLLEKIGK